MSVGEKMGFIDATAIDASLSTGMDNMRLGSCTMKAGSLAWIGTN